MKRLIAFVLSFMLAMTFGFSWTGQASAVDKESISKQIKTASKEYKDHEALVMFKSSKSVSTKKTQSMLKSGDNSISDIKVIETWNFSEPVDGSGSGKDSSLKAGANGFANVALVKSDSLSTEEIIKRFEKRSDVLYAEPNYKIRALAVSDDPYSKYQWSMGKAGGNVSSIWGEGVTESNAIVAVVDTGVDYKHEDLADNMWENSNYPTLKGECGFDFIKADDDPMDENGHGTHCAGIIGAMGDNGVGISGVNKKVRIMALRILDEEGFGDSAGEVAAYSYISKALDCGEPVKAINNSWGGGEYSDIFAKLVDLVGEKGAVSVMAAGNDGMDNDKYADYPSGIDSDYKIVVGATKLDGNLVSFSNYGANSVDVAAPGTDILSTVCYECYNPSIYTEEENAEISKEYNGYEDSTVSESGNDWGIPDAENVKLPEGATYSAEIVNDGIPVQSGDDYEPSKALKLSFTGMKADSAAIISMPYTLDTTEVDEPQHFSMISKCDATVSPDDAFVVAADLPADAEITKENFDTYSIDGFYMEKGQDYWNHLDYECLQDDDFDEIATDRKLVIIYYTDKAGDYSITIDDMGVSNENLEPSKFKKYDFMSGTSMAAPFVTGAVALKAQQLENADTLTVIGETIRHAKDTPVLDKINVGGGFDFSKKQDELKPRIGNVKLGKDKDTIVLSGSGLNPSTGLDVQISYAGKDDYKPAEVVKTNDNGTEVILKDQKWINNLVDIKVTGYGSKTTEKKDIYLVKGKKPYTAVNDTYGIDEGDKMITDGRRIYTASSSLDSIMELNPSNPSDGFEAFATIDTGKLFKDSNSSGMQDMVFSRDLASIKGKIYTVIEYGEAVEKPEEDEFFWFFSKSGKAVKKMSVEGASAGSIYAADGVLYSSELRLIVANPKTGNYSILCKLPKDLETTVDWTMASYNGKLYFIGGYNMGKDSEGNRIGLTKKVHVYDPATKKWTAGKSLPEGRAGGQAIQSGSKLYYTMGYGEGQTGVSQEDQVCPKNLVFNGTKWVKASAKLTPLDVSRVEKRGGNTYNVYDGNIGICKGGIVYIGTPAEDYGDTFKFTYADGKYTFKDTGYNYSDYPETPSLRATAHGSKIYVIDSADMSKAPIASGLVKVKYTKSKHGTVTGVNRYFAPGDKTTIKVKAKKNYRISYFKVGSKQIKLGKKTTKKTYVTGPINSNVTVKVKFKKIKKK